MRVLTGDIVCIGPTPGNATRFQWLIQRTGSWSTHNAIVCVDRRGTERVLDIAAPSARLIPLDEYRKLCNEGTRRMVIIRYHKWPAKRFENPIYDVWRKEVAVAIRLIDMLSLPYDWTGIVSQARTWLRDKVGLPRILKHVEWKIWCSEGVALIYAATRVYVSRLRRQPQPAPIHFEKALADGEFYVVENMGVPDELLGKE